MADDVPFPKLIANAQRHVSEPIVVAGRFLQPGGLRRQLVVGVASAVAGGLVGGAIGAGLTALVGFTLINAWTQWRRSRAHQPGDGPLLPQQMALCLTDNGIHVLPVGVLLGHRCKPPVEVWPLDGISAQVVEQPSAYAVRFHLPDGREIALETPRKGANRRIAEVLTKMGATVPATDARET